MSAFVTHTDLNNVVNNLNLNIAGTAHNLNLNLVGTSDNLQDNQDLLEERINKEIDEQVEVLDNKISTNNALLDATTPIIGGSFSGGWTNTNNIPVMGAYLTGPYSYPGSMFGLGVTMTVNALNRNSSLSAPIRRLEFAYNSGLFVEKFQNFKDSLLVTPVSTGVQDELFKDKDYNGVLLPGFHALEKDLDGSKTVVKIFDYIQAVSQVWSSLSLTNQDNFIVLNVRFLDFEIAYGKAYDNYFINNASSFERYWNGELKETIPTKGNGPKVQTHDLDISAGIQAEEVQKAIDIFKNLPNLTIYTHLWGNSKSVYDTLVKNNINNEKVYMLWWAFPWKIEPEYTGMNYLTPINIAEDTILHDQITLHNSLNNNEIDKFDNPFFAIGILDALVNYSIIASAGKIISLDSVTASAKENKVDNRLLDILGTNENDFFKSPMTAGYNLSEVFIRTL